MSIRLQSFLVAETLSHQKAQKGNSLSPIQQNLKLKTSLVLKKLTGLKTGKSISLATLVQPQYSCNKFRKVGIHNRALTIFHLSKVEK